MTMCKPIARPEVIDAGRRFLDQFHALVRQDGLTPERLAVLFAGFDVLKASLPSDDWERFRAESDEHPLSSCLLAAEDPAQRRSGTIAIRSGPTLRRRISYR